MHTIARINAIATLIFALFMLSAQCMQMYSLLQVWEKVPGVTIQTYTVKEKWMKQGYSLRNPDHYYISWIKGNKDITSNYTIMLTKERWEKIKPGQEVTVYFTSLSDRPFVRNNYTDSPLEIAVIIAIAVISVGFALWMIVFLVSARPTPPQPWDNLAYQSSFYQGKKKRKR